MQQQHSPSAHLSFDLLSTYGVETHILRPFSTAPALLVVFAHPDDESFTTPGTLAAAAEHGVDVHYVCATRGECGAVPAEITGDTDIAALRTSELLEAGRALGLTAIHFLPYHDSGMAGAPSDHPRALARAPLDEVTEQIVAIIRLVRPQSVITFGPNGGYGHPDHIAVHLAAHRAFQAAGDATAFAGQLARGLLAYTPQRLYDATFGTRWLRTVVTLLRATGRNSRRFGANADVDLVQAVEGATPVTTLIDTRRYHAQKERAWAAHQSQRQTLGPLFLLPVFLRRRIMRFERFTRIEPTRAPNEPLETDVAALWGAETADVSR